MDTTWLSVIATVQDISIVVALVIFFMTRRTGRKQFKMIGWILALSALSELGSLLCYYVFKVNMNLLTNLYALSVVPVYFLFFKSKVSSSGVLAVMKILTIAFLVFGVINMLFIQGPHDIEEYTKAFQSFVLVVFALMYFYVTMKNLPTQLITGLPMFWINAAILIYYSEMFLIYLLTEYVLTVLKGSIIVIWMVHNSIGVIHYAMISAGLWRNRSLYTPGSL